MNIGVSIKDYRTTALVDSGAAKLFISERMVQQLGIPTRMKKRPYKITVVDGSPLPGNKEGVDEETIRIPVSIGTHHEEVAFDVIRMATHDIVLGLPWLQYHNPTVNWKLNSLEFDGCHCMKDNGPTRNKERINPVDENCKEICEVSYSNTGTLDTDSDSIDTGKGHPGHEKIRVHEEKHAPPEIPREYQQWLHLFRDEATTKALPKHQTWDHEIKLEPGTQPTFRPIYALSEKELQELRKYLDENLKKGFIKKSESPAGYPILFVPKKDGSLRLCVDYRDLNRITIKNRYPLPNIGELQDRLKGAKWFTALDLRGAYNLIRMKEGEEWKTAFRTRYGHYEYTVMPFGLTNAPATCQALINDTLRPLLDICVVAYLDDILVYSETFEQHVTCVKKVMKLLDSRDLRLKPEKCEFHKQEVTFLGFVVGSEGIRMDPKKIAAIKDWPTPTNVKEVQGFLGFANYNRKFIKDYSKISKPLTELTKKDQPFQWKDKEEGAFQKLIASCTTDPLLRMFDPTKAVTIETDASDMAIGACLSQKHDERMHPVAYYSRSLSPAEQNYDIHDKELLAIVAALEHWRVYAEGSVELTILTDHKNLLYFTTTKMLNRRQVRWSELLGQYKFTIKYTPGKDNERADALSRRSDYMTKEPIQYSILKENKDGSITGNTQEINATMVILDDTDEQFPIHRGRMRVPDKDINIVIKRYHDSALHGHPGIKQTYENVLKKYTFPKMKDRITEYIAACATCKRSKPTRHKQYGQIQMLPPPTEAWEEITMDFITKLPESQDPATKEYYDSILVVVDRLTKYCHYIPFRESYTAEQLSYVLLDRVLRIRGIPKVYITDRDKLFTSKYWKTLTALMGTKHKLSTAYHPQTDGQTERKNQDLEIYLRMFVTDQQNNWVSLLPIAEIALNNRTTEATGLSPAMANYGRNLAISRERMQTTENSENALQLAQNIQKITANIGEKIAKRNQHITTRENKKRIDGPQLKKGDKVYLRTKNLKSKKPSKKLDSVKVGPFIIKEVKGPVTYELQLPKDARVHPVFHVSMLEPADPKTPIQETFHFVPEEEITYEIEKILNERNNQYLIKWKGYPDSENTWEPKKNITHLWKLVQEYQTKKRRTRTP